MSGRPYSGLKAQAETVVGSSDRLVFDDDEKTAIEPGKADAFDEAKTVADSPENAKITRPEDIPPRPGGETVDELTLEEPSEIVGLPAAALVVTQGPNKGQRFELKKIVTTVGRGLNNDIVLLDTSVSRRHLKIEYDGLHFYLTDLGSGNGTVVNTRDEDERFRLSHRDALELGRTVIAFDCATARARPPLSPRAKSRGPTSPPPLPAGRAASVLPGVDGKPTRPLRAEDPHPAFDDIDDEASTIAGSRPPGPGELPMGGAAPLQPPGNRASGKKRQLQRPQDLVVPRSPPGQNNLRRTVASSSVPAPTATPRPSPVRRSTLPPNQQVALGKQHPPPHFDDDDDDDGEGLTRPARPSGRTPPRSMPPSATLPPVTRPPPEGPTNPRPPGVVYPSAPSQFMRANPPSAITPRPVNHHMGVVQPGRNKGKSRWGLVAVVVVIAAIGGVAIAAVLGGGGNKAGGGDDNPIAGKDADAAPAVTNLADAGAAPASDAGATVAALAIDAASAPPAVDAATTQATTPIDAAATMVATGPVVRGSLTTGASLPRTTWGTDENVVSSIPDVKPLDPNPEDPDVTDPNDSGDTDSNDSGDADSNDSGDTGRKDPKDTGRKDPKDTGRKDPKDTGRKDSEDTDRGDDGGDRKQQLAKLKRRADAAYRDRNFASAASAASSAAKLARGRDARRLRNNAANYRKLGRYLSQARKTGDSNPRVALSSYARARSVDRRLGGRHRRFIQNQLLIVAPKAARKAMAAGDLVGAKRAVDAARGAGDKVQTDNVVRSLENKARALISKSKKAQRSGDKDAARGALNEARRILPATSSLNSQVKTLLSELD